MKNATTTKRLSTLALVAATLLSVPSAQALTKKIDLNMDGIHVRDFEVMPIKRMLNRQVGRRALRGFQLKEIEVQAKSRLGDSQISLRVNHNESLPKTVSGTEEQFASDYSGFSTITLKAPYSHRGLSQRSRVELIIDGETKLKDATLKMQKELRYDYTNVSGLLFERSAEIKANKVIGSSKTIHVNGMLDAIELEGTKRKVSVDKVEIEFRDGETVIIDELEGKLRQGNVKAFALRGELLKPVRKIKVSASTTSLFGSRGKVAINLAK